MNLLISAYRKVSSRESTAARSSPKADGVSFIARKGVHTSMTLLSKTPLSNPRLMSRTETWLLLLTGLCCLLLAAWPAEASVLEGRLQLMEKSKDRTKQEARFAVVYFVPDQPVSVEPLVEVSTMTMARKEFVPRVLTVTAGSRVEFPNGDGILHNVFSLSGRNRFDLGLYRRGESKETVLSHPGIVQVFCNVHHAMVAYILVLDTPFYTTPDRNGNFRLEGLPKGPGKLVVWHERSESVTRPMQSVDLRDLSLQLEITKPRIPKHRNKFGKPYSRKRRGRAY